MKEKLMKNKMIIAIVVIVAAFVGWSQFSKAHATTVSFTNEDVLSVMYTMSESYDYDNIGYDTFAEQRWGTGLEVAAKLRDDELTEEDLVDMMAEFQRNGGDMYGTTSEVIQYAADLQGFADYMVMLNNNPQAHEPYEFWNGMSTMEYYMSTIFSWLDGEEEWKSTVFYNVAKLHGLNTFIDPDA